MVSKKFGDLLVSAELEEDEMWRRGTIRIDFEKGDLFFPLEICIARCWSVGARGLSAA